MIRSITRSQAILYVASATLLGSLTGVPAAQAAGPGCSINTLHGQFGFYRSGNTPDGPLAAVGSISFDGRGNAYGTQSISRNGAYSFDLDFINLYEVKTNCSGRLLFTDGTEFARLVVINGGKGFYIFSESLGNAIYGVGTRIDTE